MAKTTIKITGFSLKEPKTRKDGVTELLFKIPMSKAVPKGLESLGDSFYKVYVGPKAWNKFTKNNAVDKDTFYIIEGESKASVNSKGVPFITINCFTIQAKPQEDSKKDVKKDTADTSVVVNETEKQLPENKENSEKKAEVTTSKKEKHKEFNNENSWRKKINESELVDINISDIDIDSQAHKVGFLQVGDKIGINSVIAVTKKENGRYSLLTGYKAFVSAKVYRENEPIKAYIYDKSRDEFVKEFGIRL